MGKLDVVIPVLHGSNGEDGIFEGVLETIGATVCRLQHTVVGQRHG